jgi:hypothetical protein
MSVNLDIGLGLLSWDNRLARIRECCPDLLGPNGWRWRVIRTSNAYKFNNPTSKYKNKSGTIPDSIPLPETGADAKKSALRRPRGIICAPLERHAAQGGSKTRLDPLHS